jgi:Spy/CpxP family protein refolding chaperone
MRTFRFTTVMTLGAASILSAQQPQPVMLRGNEPLIIVDGVQLAAPPKDDPFAAYFFPPELIMAHQSELGLQDAQRTAIISELQKAQSTFLQLQWKMSEETQRLEKLLQPATVDEARVLEQVDRTLAAEREIKRTQIGMLIRIKNTLTPQQQAKLNELRKSSK